ncbi:MAG TPA: hypothetical protein VHY08_29905 [Bacillota bacterium]|nr:hypothetical protein [Bacillota bacterium]
MASRETRLLLEGKPWEQFPEQLQQKVKELNMFDYLGALPRNLTVLFNQKV